MITSFTPRLPHVKHGACFQPASSHVHFTLASFLCLTVTSWYGSPPLINVLVFSWLIPISANKYYTLLNSPTLLHIKESIWCQLAAALESSRALLQSVLFRKLRPNRTP